MAGLRAALFEHHDTGHAAACLASCDGPAVLATDSVFAADGSLAPAADLHASLRPGDRLLLDDCHGFAVFGSRGRGMADHAGLPRDERLVVTTTLAKGLGCGGGIVMGDGTLIATARARSTAYICTTPASPVLAAAALEALRLLQTDPSLHDRLRENTRMLRHALRGLGVAPDAPAPVVAFAAGTAESMRATHDAALSEGFLAPLVTYPGGPAPVYFRLSVSSAHTHAQIDRLAAVLLDASASTLTQEQAR
jgi:8-amino-7-oxononanoate synthase